MFLGHESKVEAVEISGSAYSKVKGKVLVSPEQGWDDYTMRRFEIAKDGFSAKHAHDFPHIVYVISGEGVVLVGEEETPIKAGSYAYISNNITHQLRNTSEGNEPLVFLCIVPQEAHTFG